MSGELSILNVGAGDVKVSFDKSNPAERIRAGRIVADMLRRGYALLVEVERNGQKAFERATGFDENTCEYIIADFDPLIAQWRDDNDAVDIELKKGESHGQSSESEADPAEVSASQSGEVPEQTSKRGRPRGSGGGKQSGRIAADKTRAVGVARSAGG